MIKKSGLALLGVMSYGIVESIIFGYDYFIVFSFILFFIICSDMNMPLTAQRSKKAPALQGIL